MQNEPRCLVCGDLLDVSAWFGIKDREDRSKEQTGAENEVCSDECYEIYTDENN